MPIRRDLKVTGFAQDDAGMVEASKQFRRVNGHLHLRALRTDLERHVAAETSEPTATLKDVSAA